VEKMTYDCTLLKELPDYPIGTKFTIVKHTDREEYYCQFPDDNGCYYANYKIPKKCIDDPKWVKKCVKESCLTDIKCKECGGTKFSIEIYDLPSYQDDGVRYYKKGIRGVCPCGCINEIIRSFTSHSKVESW
jgi:hypothetical protein